MGETQERERVLTHFSRRYCQCNPDDSTSEGTTLPDPPPPFLAWLSPGLLPFRSPVTSVLQADPGGPYAMTNTRCPIKVE